jgi:hypothetical protein
MLYEQCVVDKKNGVSKLCDITFKIRMRLINNLCIDIRLGLRFKQTQLDHKRLLLKFYDYLVWWNMSSIYYRTLIFYNFLKYWNPIQCEHDSNFSIFDGIYIQGMFLKFHLSCFKVQNTWE